VCAAGECSRLKCREYRESYRTVGELDRRIDSALEKNGREVSKVQEDIHNVYPLRGGEWHTISKCHEFILRNWGKFDID
jgi:hypothetical protein